jgi:hypothetical protein
MNSQSIDIDKYDEFYNLLFESNEGVCWSWNIYGNTVRGKDLARQHRGANFFSINPLLPGGRKDDNVSCYRNILIEFDNLPLDEQKKLLAKVPKSTIVFSGGKSLHAIISLVDPCESREEYNDLVSRILLKLPDADKSVKNPSRLSRAPYADRAGVMQELLYLGRRYTKTELNDWLGPVPEIIKQESIAVTGERRLLHGHTKYFLGFGSEVEVGTWNRSLYLSTLDMARSGYTEDEIWDRLYNVTGKLDKKDKSTIKSALKAAEQDK